MAGTPPRPVGNAGRGRHTGKVGWLGGKHRQDGCCSYELAARALARGKGRLAVRYIRMDLKARMGVI